MCQMAIYTKTGDKGETKVFDKKTKELKKVAKSSCQVISIGTLDELNSFLGIIKSFSENRKMTVLIEEIQNNLFTINSVLAGAGIKFSKNNVNKLEKQIDEWEGSLPVQKNFIYYGGSKDSSLIFYARAICRRAERSLVAMGKAGYVVPEHVLSYVNRLSDYLFMMARASNAGRGIAETFWIPGGKPRKV